MNNGLDPIWPRLGAVQTDEYLKQGRISHSRMLHQKILLQIKYCAHSKMRATFKDRPPLLELLILKTGAKIMQTSGNNDQNLRISHTLTTQALQQIKDHLPAIVIAVESTAAANTIHTFPLAIRGLGYYRRNFPTVRAASLTDMVVRDNLQMPNRFSVKYLLHSVQFNTRYVLSFVTSEYRAIPSRTTAFKDAKAIFASAAWLEREAWDLYGLYFSANPNLRRLLTDYGFSGHALRKDFPLTGFFEYVYDPVSRCILVEGAELNQELREYREFKL